MTIDEIDVCEMTDELTMTDGQRLLRRILECPEDDAPRLVLSDWLEENGEEERAKEIRYFVANPLFVIASPLGTNGIMVALRGFIAEVRLTCEQFCGGPCPGCVGQNLTPVPDRPWFECPLCNNNGRTISTGRIEGVARELFERHPITRVVLVDKRPGLTSAPSWTWGATRYQTQEVRFRDEVKLPNEIFDLIPANPGLLVTRTFTSEADALDALSAACVAWGRKLAGLPLPADNSTHQ
jgi:hypothetical protein